MKYNKIIILSAAVVFVVGFLLFSLEKLQVTNIYVKPVAAATQSPRPVNDVDYTPVTSPSDPTINTEKNLGENSDQTTTPGSVTVTITRANQDASNNLNVGVLVDGAKTGICKLELSKNNIVIVTKTANVTEQSGLTTCAGFSVLATEIPAAGTYDLKISVGTDSATQNVEIKK